LFADFSPVSRRFTSALLPILKSVSNFYFIHDKNNSRFQAQPNRAQTSAFAHLMRVLIQRVSDAKLIIGGVGIASIFKGLVVLLAIEDADGEEDIDWLSGKIVRLRIFDDENGLMNRSVQDVQGEVLLVSQFTLFASTKKGNRPSFSRSARPEVAIPLYEKFVARLQMDLGRPVQTGQFGAHMLVNLTNDGPVTIIIDSKNKE
jgi:D-tyrosyl-tRNA(Tyr) deacylase